MNLILSTCFAVLAVARYISRDSLVLSVSTNALSSRDITDTGYAKYLGNRSFPNTVAYLGIPYAEPPLGERRFRAPLPLDTGRISESCKDAVVDATKYPNFCIQGTTGAGDAGGAGSEDCLKVNIYAPVGAKQGSNLPVLVYIHGGGYTYGNPANWPFDHWIHQSPNVVIVSVYYRLSSFGFLATPEFRDPANGDLNAGFLDQIEALKWVKRHIGAFGGDSTKVTINGQSAGGSSVELHLVAEEGDVLFRGAIVQSLARNPLPSPEQQEALFKFYVLTAGCYAESVSAQLACLRNSSVSALSRAQDAATYSTSAPSGYNAFHPVVDGKIITDFPTRSILNDKFSRVPLMVGATTNETGSRGTDVPTALRSFFPSLSNDSIAVLKGAYPFSDFSSTALQFQTITGDSELRCGRTLMGEAFASHSDVWTYRYNQPNPTLSSAFGVAHAAENWMMFQGTNTGFNGSTTFTQMTPLENAFAQELIAYWLSFVRTGNPNTYKLARSPTWSSYAKANRMRMMLQEDPSRVLTRSGSVLEVESSNEASRCALVGSLVAEMED